MLKHITIQGRLRLTMLFLGLVVLLVAGAGIFGMKTINDFQQETNNKQMPSTVDLHKSNVEILRARLSYVRIAENLPKMIANSTLESQIASARKQMEKSDAAYKDYVAMPMSNDEKALATPWIRARQSFVETSIEPVIAALRSGDQAKASSIIEHQMRDSFMVMDNAATPLLEWETQRSNANYAKSVANFHEMIGIMIVLMLGAIVAAVGSAWSLQRAITVPLAKAVESFGQMSRGDLTQPIVAQSKDEMGQLLNAAENMRATLVDTIGSVRQSSDQIAAATQQIAVGNVDLSSRTEEQAASLEETASSMEEMTTTVTNNTASARQAAELSNEAATVAKEGRDVMGRVVSTMDEIEKSSRKVTDISSVIDGIAFQTNILALNAAVETARAGEQGRGFAVVAGEVRTLAQRSATAAKDIKGLLVESNGHVKLGADMVNQAGKTIEKITQSVDRVVGIMNDISLASTEQSEGIQQVNRAVSQMDAVTQQNAALVEEASAAASSLNDQAVHLQRSVSVFQLPTA